jgi:steroid delta-isomerase-like uncharacterized protein
VRGSATTSKEKIAMAQTETTMNHTEAAAGGALEPAFAADFAQRWLDAWNSHEVGNVLALMADDVVYDDSAWPKTMRGHGDVVEFVESTWRGLPDLRFEMTGGPFLHPTEPRAAYYWRALATHTGPIDPPGLAPTGRRIEMHGGDFHEYRDGKLVRVQIVFDLADTMRQLGVLPEPGSRAERFTIGLANLQARARRRG